PRRPRRPARAARGPAVRAAPARAVRRSPSRGPGLPVPRPRQVPRPRTAPRPGARLGPGPPPGPGRRLRRDRRPRPGRRPPRGSRGGRAPACLADPPVHRPIPTIRKPGSLLPLLRLDLGVPAATGVHTGHRLTTAPLLGAPALALLVALGDTARVALPDQVVVQVATTVILALVVVAGRVPVVVELVAGVDGVHGVDVVTLVVDVLVEAVPLVVEAALTAGE